MTLNTLIMLFFKKKCAHKNTFIFTEYVVTCEKTTTTCLDCHKKLSVKTDCR
jgi:hypothetical protein